MTFQINSDQTENRSSEELKTFNPNLKVD